MALEVRVVTGTLCHGGDASYTDFEYSGFGTPQACIVLVTDAYTTGNPSTRVVQSVGVYDGTNQYAMCWSHRASVNSVNGAGRFANGGRIALVKEKASSTPTYTTYAEYTASWATNGVRLTLSEDDTTLNRYATVILIKGATNVKANTVTMNGTTPVDHTGVGFKPDLLYFLNVGISTGFDGEIESNIISCSVGIAHNDSSDTVTQHCVSVNCTVDASSRVNVSVNDNCIARQFYNNGSTIDRKNTVSAFDSSGFSIVSDAANTALCAYLAIELDDPDDAYLTIIDTKTSTGTQGYTGAGFQPQALLLMGMPETATNSSSTSPTSGVTFGAAANASSGFTEECYATAIADASSTPAVMSRRTASILDLRNTSDTQIAAANLDSFDVDGWTLDYTAADATARKVIALALAEAATSGAPTISDLQAVNITSSSVQATYDYAF